MLLSLAISSAVPMRDEEELGSLERRLILHNAPPSPFPETFPPGPPEALPYPILRRMSSTSQSRAAPRYALLRAARPWCAAHSAASL
jgi:hypothetical protein